MKTAKYSGVRPLFPRATLLCLLVALVAGPAVAGPPDQNPATDSLPRALPYEGHLSVDGVPLNLDLEVTFRLWSLAAGGEQLYEETLPVHFVNGKFSVLLGENDARVPTAVFDAADIYVGVTINNTELRGRQRIVPVPHALWAARAADFTVAGALTVQGPATVTGGLSVDSLTFRRGGISPVTGFTPSGEFRAERGQTTLMTPVASSFCFLQKVQNGWLPQRQRIDVGGFFSGDIEYLVASRGPCVILDNGGTWAISNGDAESCAARCISLR